MFDFDRHSTKTAGINAVELNIKTPIQIDFSVNEIEEERVKSFKSDVSIKVEVFSSDARLFFKNIWFDCAGWDAFVKDLKVVRSKEYIEATLSDMSQNLSISISGGYRDYKFISKINKSSVEGAKLDFVYEVPLVYDQVRHIEDAFSNFPRWW